MLYYIRVKKARVLSSFGNATRIVLSFFGGQEKPRHNMRGNLIGFFILCGDAVGLEVLNITETDMLIRQPTHMPQLPTCPPTWRVHHLHDIPRLEAV